MLDIELQANLFNILEIQIDFIDSFLTMAIIVLNDFFYLTYHVIFYI